MSVGNFDGVPGVSSGEAAASAHRFAELMDFGSVQRARLTAIARTEAAGAEPIDGPGGSGMWDAPDAVDGTDGNDSAPFDVQIWGRLTADDPGAAPLWGEPRRIDGLDLTCRAIGQPEVRIAAESLSFNVLVFELSLHANQF